MDQVDGMFCKLCLQNTVEKSFQVIGEVILKALAFLSLNVSLDERENYMCNDCSEKLFAAFDFKVMCLDTEDSLLPYIDAEEAWQVDLRDAYLKVKQATVTLDQQVCRLCMRIVDDGFMPIEKLCDRNMVHKYIPEVNFSITKDPVVCKKCWNSLDTYIDCLKKWTNVEKTIKIEPKDSNDYLCIKSEEIDLKIEQHNEDGELSLRASNETILKCEPINETCMVKQEIENWESINTHTFHTSGSDGIQENHTVLYETDDTKTISKDADHKIKRRPKRKVRVFKCDTCFYETKYKYNFTKHLLKHEDPSKVEMYRCDKCNYESRWKDCLLRHQLVHKEVSELQLYKCKECDYQTKWRGNLRKHQITHKDPLEVPLYKCQTCSFQTKVKCSIKRHQLIHESSSSVQMFKCEKCDFETLWKNSLEKHQITHESSAEVKMYKCDKCDHQTKHKYNMKLHHQVRHEFGEKTFKCNECEFESKKKGDLAKHQILHRAS